MTIDYRELYRLELEKVEALNKENLALADENKELRTTLKLSTEKDKGRFYCNWCGEMKPIEERREITDATEHVIWFGCMDCHENKKRLDNATE